MVSPRSRLTQFYKKGVPSVLKGYLNKILYGFGFYFFAFYFYYAMFAAQKNTFIFTNYCTLSFFAAFWAYVVCVWG